MQRNQWFDGGTLILETRHRFGLVVGTPTSVRMNKNSFPGEISMCNPAKLGQVELTMDMDRGFGLLGNMVYIRSK